mmetsp:Transcript_134871/g.336552  ORF Transcript_134871/g.336552 Transcript_134871/m.336552 type:complete len:261 (-) Transcript_134871:392-1174(-)|eukprot:CAMPEP_0115271714 /NCGR_PEP_ID=MMETSP0270-20121206/54248_1 /TAXON_ID=71861 /ORGANISM="Scrippsiella trochoidea, Strain CCMP3099" /LENGTH=260 /DNA_ID=CAMNT_0002688095 /DNA_START=34 /DNA_END=816 /DNA_ORIENTATION=+
MGNTASPKQGASSSELGAVGPSSIEGNWVSQVSEGQEAAKKGGLPTEARSPVLLDKPALSRPDSKLSKPSSGGSAGQSVDPTALKVVVVSCRGLRNADWMPGWGSSDPYCVCSIVGKPDQSFTTKVMQNTLDPIWNHRGQLSGFEAGDTLEFKVFDKDMLKKDDLLGQITLSSEVFMKDGFSGEVPLSKGGRKVQPFLRLRIEAPPRDLPPLPPPASALLEDEDMVALVDRSTRQPTVIEVVDQCGLACPHQARRLFWCC